MVDRRAFVEPFGVDITGCRSSDGDALDVATDGTLELAERVLAGGSDSRDVAGGRDDDDGDRVRHGRGLPREARARGRSRTQLCGGGGFGIRATELQRPKARGSFRHRRRTSATETSAQEAAGQHFARVLVQRTKRPLELVVSKDRHIGGISDENRAARYMPTCEHDWPTRSHVSRAHDLAEGRDANRSVIVLHLYSMSSRENINASIVGGLSYDRISIAEPEHPIADIELCFPGREPVRKGWRGAMPAAHPWARTCRSGLILAKGLHSAALRRRGAKTGIHGRRTAGFSTDPAPQPIVAEPRLRSRHDRRRQRRHDQLAAMPELPRAARGAGADALPGLRAGGAGVVQGASGGYGGRGRS